MKMFYGSNLPVLHNILQLSGNWKSFLSREVFFKHEQDIKSVMKVSVGENMILHIGTSYTVTGIYSVMFLYFLIEFKITLCKEQPFGSFRFFSPLLSRICTFFLQKKMMTRKINRKVQIQGKNLAMYF